ncbi:peptidase S8 [Candidatus Gottesmanbacteria bacterium]|nr:peptidase S8 [Candidatus Gottesmanbacteria bacterium]
MRIRFFGIFSLFFFLFLFFLLQPLSVKAQEGLFSDERVLIQMRPALPEDERLKFHRLMGVSQIGSIERTGVDILRVEKGQVAKKIEELSRDPRVVFAEPDYIATVLELTNDPGIVNNLQWGMYKVKAAGSSNSAWNYSKGDGVKVAILDTGIDQDHEDLSGKVQDKDNKNCTDSSTVDDLYGHGTHVAGIVAASTNNSLGVAGLGYNASLMNVKVLDDSGSGYYSWITNCIIWAADNGAKVINMSLGGPSKSKTLENAINYAWGKGVVLVAAAGNSGNSSPTYPGYYTNIIAVAATDVNDQKASWSSFGRWVDVAAPGVSIYSTFPNHRYTINKSLGYDYASGTSMATPHVAGLAALVWATSYGTSNSNVRKQIESTSDKIAGTGRYWAYGRINALAAVTGVIASAGQAKGQEVPLMEKFKMSPFSRFGQK